MSYRGSRDSRFLWIYLLGIVVLAVLAGLLTFGLNLRGAEQLQMPNLVGEELSEALLKLQERELYTTIRLRFSPDSEQKGQVIEQSPAPGASIRAGKTTTLVISRGAIVDRVESYIGRDLNEVNADLQGLASDSEPSIRIADVGYVYDSSPAGTILQQFPPPETEIGGATPLDLVVSRGPQEQTIEVPVLVGLGYREAIILLADRDLPFVFSINTTGGSESAGTIAGQIPEAGAQVVRDSMVQLALYPPLVSDNNVFGLFERVLPTYPVAVELSLIALQPNGDRKSIFSMRHPGGTLAIPYLEPPGTQLILQRYDTEVLTYQVSAAE